MLQAADVTFGYGETSVLRGVSLAVRVGIGAGAGSVDGEDWFGAPGVEA